MKRILCYGDSNTWGYISGSDHLRYDENTRWTRVLGNNLGKDFEVIEEGLNSRTLFNDDPRPGKEGKNGFAYLKPCLESQDKIDLIILMLGTNELKYIYNNSAQDIVDMISKYVEFISNFKSQIDKSTPDLIISGLPIISEDTSYGRKDDKYKGASPKNKELNRLLEIFCKTNNIDFVNNNDLEVGIDGVHFTQESHKLLGNRLAELIKSKYSN